MSRDKIIKAFLRQTGKKGGKANTKAQNEARARNAVKAREARKKKA